MNLICIEDGIDSNKESGKLMISVLSAVAEIERENILVQTMESRRQKAREVSYNHGNRNTTLEKLKKACDYFVYFIMAFRQTGEIQGSVQNACENG